MPDRVAALFPCSAAERLRHAARVLVALALLALARAAWAGEADVVAAKGHRVPGGDFSFSVTIRSRDKGWDYYCDRFEVLSPQGKVLGVRELLHPHETEQPFTREPHGVQIPPGITHAVIRAHHKPRGYDGATLKVELRR